MRDVGELREVKTKLGEEAEHLTGDALYVVLSADDNEGRDLVADAAPCPLLRRMQCARTSSTRGAWPESYGRSGRLYAGFVFTAVTMAATVPAIGARIGPMMKIAPIAPPPSRSNRPK
jgi:hypothetical protein